MMTPDAATIRKHKAPGKIILSGEHSVVYGEPALAMSVNQYVNVNLNQAKEFICSGLNETRTLRPTKLSNLLESLNARYADYASGKLDISSVLSDPSELVFYTIALYLKQFKLSLEDGLSLAFDFEFPIGCGMGASAACICATLIALNDYFKLQPTLETLYDIALTAENLQHGRSSGLDCRMSLHGGLVLLQNDEMQRQKNPNLPFHILNTGKPDCSTGECVNHVKKFKEDNALWHAFRDVTLALNDAIQENSLDESMMLIRENHRLLTRIGTVPEKQQAFIKECEKENIAAKLSGAGAVRGEHGGICLMLSDDLEKLNHLHQNAIAIKGEEHGAQSL